MSLIEKIYEAAANVGFLKKCIWRPSDGSPPHANMVDLRAPDDSVLDNLTLSTETTISYPAVVFDGIRPREIVEVDGVTFQVREVRATGDGSEMRAKLSRL
jgi:hypothetical protein